MTTNLNNNMPVDQAALDRLLKLEERMTNVLRGLNFTNK